MQNTERRHSLELLLARSRLHCGLPQAPQAPLRVASVPPEVPHLNPKTHQLTIENCANNEGLNENLIQISVKKTHSDSQSKCRLSFWPTHKLPPYSTLVLLNANTSEWTIQKLGIKGKPWFVGYHDASLITTSTSAYANKKNCQMQ